MAPTTPAPAGPPQGRGLLVVGRYRLRSPIGRGGMGVVWSAHDEVLGREVAVKEVTPPPGLSAEQAAQLRVRTLREARAAARIRSSAAVTVFDVVEQDGRPWIVMELLPPRSLADVLREDGPLAPEAAARVGLRVLDALTAAHASGVLHRDVKPANVLVDAPAGAVLTDFGIASLEGDPSMTTTGTLVGSPGYVAPERARGSAPTPASDLWSLGVTLSAAVLGRSPFERDTPMATLVAVLEDPPPQQALAGGLGAVLDGLLQKDPAQRLDAAAAAAMLRQVVADGRTSTRPVPAVAAGGRAAASEGPTAERTQALPLPPRAPAVPRADGSASPAGPREPVVAPPAGPRRRAGRSLAALAVAALATAGGLAVALPNGDERADSAAPAAPAAPAVPSAGAPGTPTAGAGALGSAGETDEDTTGQEPSIGDSGADGAGGSEQPPDSTRAGPGAGSGAGSGARPGADPDARPDASGESDAAGDGGAPDGFERYEDDAFRVDVPSGWAVEADGIRTTFSDPSSRRFFFIEEGGEPAGDPVEDWERQEGVVSQRLPGYELLGIERADYRGFEAADWEFTYEPDGRPLRVLNRAVVDDDQAYALYWAAPPGDWEGSLSAFEVVADSFRSRGG